MEKLHIEKDTIQETLIIPLYARKLCTELFPGVYQDHSAAELMDRLDYDFSEIEKKSQSFMHRFGALEIAMRENDLAWEVRDYLKTHPEAAVVNLGCGLDQTGELCDNGTCHIYNIDMPDVLSVRNQLLPPGERTTNLSADLNDFAWFDQVDGSHGAVFFAAGVFYYFKKEEVEALFNAMALHFPGGRLVLDTCNKMGCKMTLKTVTDAAGIAIKAEDYFHTADINDDVRPWLRSAKASARGYMLGYDDLRDPSIPGFFRFMGKVGDNFIKMKILRIDFDEKN